MQQEQNNNTFTIEHKEHGTYTQLNNIPCDTEILEIKYICLNGSQKFDNLPTTLKEINIGVLKKDGSGGMIVWGMSLISCKTTLSKWIKSIFPKIPLGCIIYYYEECPIKI